MNGNRSTMADGVMKRPRADGDANGTLASRTVDAAGRVMQITDAPTANPATPFASFAYGRDGANQLTSVASTGVPTDNNTYTYTSLNQLSHVNSTSYSYDSADNLTGLTNGTVQSYDAANELTQAQQAISLVGTASAEGGSTSGNQTLSLPAGVQPNDQVLLATTEAANVSVTTPAGYTLVGSATTGTNGKSTQTVLFRHTVASGDTSVTLAYSAATTKTVVMAVYRGVDPLNPVDAQSSGTTSSGTQVTAPSVTATLAGDRLVDVLGATQTKSAASWTQPAGMTDEVHRSDMPQSATALGDQPLPAAGATGVRTASFGTSAALVSLLVALRPAVVSYGYDGRGNRISRTPAGGSATTLGYDQANRLTSYGSSATYAYNGDGLRASKTVSGATTPFTWDVSGDLPLLLADGSNSYVYGQGEMPLEQISSAGSVLYFHQDQLGSTRVLSDQNGAVQGSYTYDAYGNPTGKTGTATTPLRNAGQYVDAESGSQYLRARYYDPATAQFLSRDPIVAATRSPYGYVMSNPLNGADRSGLVARNRLSDQQASQLTNQCSNWINQSMCVQAAFCEAQQCDQVQQIAKKNLATLQRALQGARPGCKVDLNGFRTDLSTALRDIREMAAAISVAQQSTTIEEPAWIRVLTGVEDLTAGTLAMIGGGAMMVAGIALAPETLGGSLIMVPLGAGLSVGGGVLAVWAVHELTGG